VQSQFVHPQLTVQNRDSEAEALKEMCYAALPVLVSRVVVAANSSSRFLLPLGRLVHKSTTNFVVLCSYDIPILLVRTYKMDSKASVLRCGSPSIEGVNSSSMVTDREEEG
jgi:hypothetical protein